ncbi:Protein of unknown function (DUF3099) [Kineococcus xinjiangensis]|uniref:DUF3099 family protein n=1 Tax=Kineococcus xinjiangensis TaxID=512762 RepID=A0A2S6IPJ0_9ACTN|nr:DUF3099 domain-containing protein [Kineococcus xinjiangensis]PPK96174.1 Protein of unknown function (DUF3099) [Kineococcus xinjiangensis]
MQHSRTAASTETLGRAGAAPEVYRISAAPTAHTADIQVRFRKYVISMLIRTVCFVLLVVIDHWVRWFFVVAAVVLPYVAVVIANAGREHRDAPPPTFEHVPEVVPAIGPTPPPAEVQVVEGRIVDAEEGPRS